MQELPLLGRAIGRDRHHGRCFGARHRGVRQRLHQSTAGLTIAALEPRLGSAHRRRTEGRVVAKGNPAEIRASTDPFVRQFVEGDAYGPVKFQYPAPDYRLHLYAESH